MNWMSDHLAEPVTVDQLAAQALMSPRTCARRFVQETGTTPQRWVTGQRILLAQRLLEETDETVDEVAERSGFRQRDGAAASFPGLAVHGAAGLPPYVP